MTKDEMKEIKARLINQNLGKHEAPVPKGGGLFSIEWTYYGRDNLDFIDHAPQDIAKLIAEVEELEKMINSAKCLKCPDGGQGFLAVSCDKCECISIVGEKFNHDQND